MSDLSKAFLRQEGAGISVLFAISLFALALGAGVTIEYSRASQAKSRLQAALDAGVLAAAKDVSLATEVAQRARIEAFIGAHTREDYVRPPNVRILPRNGRTLAASASGCIRTVFKGIIGVDQQCVVATTDVEMPLQTYLEVALVLDNSVSMEGAKLEAAKASAIQFAEHLFAGVTDPEQVKIAVVPFTMTVNAGSGMNVRSDPSLDRFGKSSIHWENLVPDGITPPTSVSSRFSLYEQLGETWTGCLEMRPGEFGINDAPPVAALPDSLFVPMFAPDEPGPLGVRNTRSELLNPNGGGRTFSQFNSYLNDDGSEAVTYDISGRETSSINPACTPLATAFRLPFAPQTEALQDKNWFARLQGNLCRYNLRGTPGDISKRKVIRHTSGTDGALNGPNLMCNAVPMQRLTARKTDIVGTINRMNAISNTNTVEGFMWGWRSLSPNLPFANGRPYTWGNGSIRNRKIIVLMTDGENYWPIRDTPAKSSYSPFGYFGNNRIGTLTSIDSARAAMNRKTLQACRNAKAQRDFAGEEAIQIYTIGYSTPGSAISANGLQLLKDCASTERGQKLFFQASDAGQLVQVFSTIAGNIGRLKVSR